ncbi:hypothetical protein MSG28_010777 [Choristoneura fumiferana]|uniref:Uncharacterized protein n=1 Tax=Choristoneura fumiferana TaxID=7141 RepID=A0ACC0KNP4_CHOFU|nr:hypothetical protein MSG28_010777 [Choristoneura fumiferana]
MCRKIGCYPPMHYITTRDRTSKTDNLYTSHCWAQASSQNDAGPVRIGNFTRTIELLRRHLAAQTKACADAGDPLDAGHWFVGIIMNVSLVKCDSPAGVTTELKKNRGANCEIRRKSIPKPHLMWDQIKKWLIVIIFILQNTQPLRVPEKKGIDRRTDGQQSDPIRRIFELLFSFVLEHFSKQSDMINNTEFETQASSRVSSINFIANQNQSRKTKKIFKSVFNPTNQLAKNIAKSSMTGTEIEISAVIKEDTKTDVKKNTMAPRKNYTPDQLEKAVEAVKNGEKVAVAAKRFGVPRITLHDKISGRTTMGCAMGPSTVLTKEEEDILEKTWFTEIESYLDENNFKTILNDPRRIFNADETAFFLSPKPGRVLAKKGDKHPYNSCGDEKDNLTVLITGNAAGDLAPPMIIFSYERIPSTIAVSVPDEWAIGKSESGWMCSSTFYEYMTNVFNPWLEQNKIEKPVLFFVDGHKSHLTLHLSNFCSENGIVVVALYPNSTHILQPMDLSVFRPLKAHWKKAVTLWKMENLGKILRKENFAPVLQKALTNLTKDCVQNGFRAGGLFPFGPDYIDMSKISKTEIETTTKTNPMQKEFMKYLEREIVNVFSAQKLQQFNKLYFENRNTLEREIPDEDEALYLIWAKNKSEDALCHSISADGPTTSDTLEQARYPSNDVTTAQTNDVVVTDEAMVIPLDAGDAVPTETEGMHFNSMQTENPPKDGNFNDLIETDSSAHNSKKSVDDEIGVTHSLPVAKTVTTDDKTFPSESISSTNLPKVIVEYLPQQLNYNVRHDAVIQPLPPPERSLPTHLSKDSLMQQPNNVPKNDTVTNQPVLIPEPTSPIGSAVVTGDPQRQQPDNTSTVNTLLDQALPPPNPSSSSSFPEVIGNDLSQQPIISTMEPQYTTPQKSLEKVLGVIVPSPFKRSLFWPENWMDSNKKRMKREKIPSTVTSKAWKEYHEKKETEKNKNSKKKTKELDRE